MNIKFSAALTAAVLCAVPAAAAPIIFFGESTDGDVDGAPSAARDAFLASFLYTATEDFEGFAVDDEPTLLTFGTGLYQVNATVTSDNAVVRDEPAAGRFATSGVNYVRTEDGFRLDFDTALYGFGFYLNDATSDVTVTLLRGSTSTDILARAFIDTSTAGVFFFGIVDRDAPIDGIILSTSRPGNPDVFDLFGLDDITVSPVPEPATWAMMIAGFGLVGGALRKRTVTAIA